jgi:hypothetical protein
MHLISLSVNDFCNVKPASLPALISQYVVMIHNQRTIRCNTEEKGESGEKGKKY